MHAIILATVILSQFPSFPPPTQAQTVFPSFPNVASAADVPTAETLVPPDDAEPVRLLVFGASWCGPCKKLAPILTSLEADGISVEHVDIDAEPARAAQYRVGSVPTTIALRGDKEVARRVGLVTLDTLRGMLSPIKFIAFSSAGCTPCIPMREEWHQAENYGINIEYRDYDKDRGIAEQYSVTKLPTTIVLYRGKEITRRTGLIFLDTLRKLAQLLPETVDTVEKEPAKPSGHYEQRRVGLFRRRTIWVPSK